MRTQTTYATRRSLTRHTRSGYADLPRNPVRIVSYARDPLNIGGLIRTAEAFMVEHVYALTPTKYTSVGTERWQPATYSALLEQALIGCIVDGYPLVALEQTDDAQALPCLLPEKMCLIVGEEARGIPADVLKNAAMAIEIPQQGMVGSLNVVTATSIALYEWMTQHGY